MGRVEFWVDDSKLDLYYCFHDGKQINYEENIRKMNRYIDEVSVYSWFKLCDTLFSA